MYEVKILYEVQKTGRAKIGDEIPIRLISAVAPSIIIYGSEKPPLSISDMVDISSDKSPLIIADWYNFGSLPKYIVFFGTVDDIEVSNVRLIPKGAISFNQIFAIDTETEMAVDIEGSLAYTTII